MRKFNGLREALGRLWEKRVLRIRVVDAQAGDERRGPRVELAVSTGTESVERVSDRTHRVVVQRGDLLEVDALTHVKIGRSFVASRVLSLLWKLRGRPTISLVPAPEREGRITMAPNAPEDHDGDARP